MENLKLEKKIKIYGKIHVKTGLHIGGTDTGIAIGGADNIVARNTFDKKPYIPGSSIKGKMRSLIEKIEGKVSIKPGKDKKGNTVYTGEICKLESEDLVQLFGFAAENSSVAEKSAPTRLLVRDAMLTDESFEKLSNLDQTNMYLTELKAENNIDRLTSAATPRFFERVTAGTEFNFEFIIDIYNLDKEGNREERLIQKLADAMELLEHDYLGGHGSRGYGQIKFKETKVLVKTAENYTKGEDWQEFDDKDIFRKFK